MKLNDIFTEMNVVIKQLNMKSALGYTSKNILKMKYGYFYFFYGHMTVECHYYIGEYEFHSNEALQLRLWATYSCSTQNKLSELSQNLFNFYDICVKFEDMITDNIQYNNIKELQ